MTNNKLTTERLNILATDLAACGFGCSGHEVQAMALELQEYRKAETADREMLKHLAVILSGSDAPGEIKALTVTARSFVDRCKSLSKERDELRNAAGLN